GAFKRFREINTRDKEALHGILPQVLNHLVVQYAVCGNNASSNGHFFRKDETIPVYIGHRSASFCADKHTCCSISYPKGPTEIDKTVNSPGTDIAEFKRGSAKKAPPPYLMAELHHPGRIKFPAVDAHCAFVQPNGRGNMDGFFVAPGRFPPDRGKCFTRCQVPHKCLLDNAIRCPC